jgi:hypothetical protein
MSDTGTSVWRRLVASAALVAVPLSGVVSRPGGLASGLTSLRWMMAALLPIVVGAIVVAAAAAGLVAWRREHLR